MPGVYKDLMHAKHEAERQRQKEEEEKRKRREQHPFKAIRGERASDMLKMPKDMRHKAVGGVRG